ncbi:tetratricopeptide repeat protein [Candidatus Dependentiae bacterium]
MNKVKQLNKRKKASVTLCIIIFFLQAHTTNSTNSTEKLVDEKKFKNDYHKEMWAVYQQKKDPQKAFELFTDLVKKNKYAYKWLINFLHRTGNNQKIASMIPLIKSAFPELIKDDPDIGFMIAYALVRKKTMIKGKCMPLVYNNTAMDILIPLHRKFPSNQKVAALTSTLYDLNNDPQNALAISQKYLNIAASRPTDFIEHFKNAARYSKLKNKTKALESAKKCLELQPKFLNGWVLLATLHDQQENTQKAIDACKKALEISGPNRIIEFMLIRLFFKLKKAQHRVGEFVMNKKCFEEAIKLMREKKHDKALDYIDKCLSEKLKQNNVPKKDLLKIKVLNNNPAQKI